MTHRHDHPTQRAPRRSAWLPRALFAPVLALACVDVGPVEDTHTDHHAIDDLRIEPSTNADEPECDTADCCPAGLAVIEGTSADDALAGDATAECYVGLAGDDTIQAGGGGDYVLAGDGDDAVRGGPGADVIAGGSGNDDLRGSKGADEIYGGDGDDDIRGQRGADVIFGGEGDDRIDAGRNDDGVDAGPGHDLVDAGLGHDTVLGGLGNDVIAGGPGNDHIYPGPGADLVDAGDGDDDVIVTHVCELVAGERLRGGPGVDSLQIPVPEAELANYGVIIEEFENIVVASGTSDCAPQLTADYYGAANDFSAREESHLGCDRFLPGRFPDECLGEDPFDRTPFLQTKPDGWTDLEQLSTRFLTVEDNSTAAVTFNLNHAGNESANFLHARSPIIIKVLVDDEDIAPGPVDVVYSGGGSGGTFTWVVKGLDAGIHSVRLQWRVDADPQFPAMDPVGLLRHGTVTTRTSGATTNTLSARAVVPDGGPDAVIAGEFETTPWTAMPNGGINFTVPEDNAAVAVTFSGEVRASLFGAMDVRPVIAGFSDVWHADTVKLAQSFPLPREGAPNVGTEPEGYASRSFTFTTNALPAGDYFVGLEWRLRYVPHPVYPANGSPIGMAVRNRSLMVVSGPEHEATTSRVMIAAPAAPNPIQGVYESWVDVDSLTYTVAELPHNSQMVVSFSGEIDTTNNTRVRLTLNGEPVDTEDELHWRQGEYGAFTRTFVLEHLEAGTYDVGVQWKLDGNGASATMRARNLVIWAEELPVPALGTGPGLGRAAKPNTDRTIPLNPANGTKKVLLVVSDPERPHVRQVNVLGNAAGLYSVQIQGQTVQMNVTNETPAQIATQLVSDLNGLGGSFHAEVRPNTNCGGCPATFRVVSTQLGANTLNPASVTSPCAGGNCGPNGDQLGTCGGTTPNLCHNAPVPDMNEIHDLAFGANLSAADYWSTVSGGLLQAEPASPQEFPPGTGVLGPYPTTYTGIDGADHYWGSHTCTGEAGKLDDGHKSGHGERMLEGLTAADSYVDFSQFDTNRDGQLAPDELILVIVTPQVGNGGSDFVPDWRPQCDDSLVEIDGVTIAPRISLYTGNNTGLVANPPTFGDPQTLAHELGHFVATMDDHYTAGNLANAAPWDSGTKDIMSVTIATGWPHPTGAHKLALGWASPRIIRGPIQQPLTVTLEDVKTSGEVIILPRPGAFGKEYYVIENRQDRQPSDPQYDWGMNDSGLLVWHVIEPTTGGAFGCDSNDPQAPDCPPMSDWLCPTQGLPWTGNPGTSFGRTAVRLIRQRLAIFMNLNANPPINDFSSLWDQFSGPLLDDAPTCPAPTAGKLRWHDGVPAGFQIDNISAPGPTMTFDLTAN